VTDSLPTHRPPTCPVDEDDAYEARLRGLTRQQLHDRLAWLSWYKPGIFTAVMDYMDFSDALADDTFPELQAS
jgi:hypothetical protein